MIRRLFIMMLSALSFTAIHGTAKYPELCPTQQTCENKRDKSCECYCSVKCGPRKKEKTDNPIWVGKDDPNKQYCYCMQRDLDDYKKNCAAVESDNQ